MHVYRFPGLASESVFSITSMRCNQSFVSCNQNETITYIPYVKIIYLIAQRNCCSVCVRFHISILKPISLIIHNSTTTSKELEDRLSCVKMTTHNRSTHPSSFTSIETLTCRHERRANQVRGNRTSPYYSHPVLSFCFTRSPSSFSTFFLSSLLNLLYPFSSPFLSYFSFLHLYFILPLTFPVSLLHLLSFFLHKIVGSIFLLFPQL